MAFILLFEVSIFIRNVLVDDRRVHIGLRGEHIAAVVPVQEATSAEAQGYDMEIDGSHMAAFPGMVNGHTHAAMTLFRGYGDDLPLQAWLSTKIWPNEEHLDEEIVYWGSRLACWEMLRGGTTCFNDMYFYHEATARAVRDAGMRAVLSLTGMDFMDEARAEELKGRCRQWGSTLRDEECSLRHSEGQVRYAVAPHAIYTVSGPTLQWLKAFADEHGLLLHMHVSETCREVEDCLSAHGCRPVEYLHRLGVLGPGTVLAHALWLSEGEVQLLADSGAAVVHNPNSNLKLGSGMQFLYSELQQAGVRVALGTDGCSSSNNLDMVEATKTMALLQKGWRRQPTVMPAAEALGVATAGGAEVLHLNAGRLQAGRLADLFLVDLDHVAFVPNHCTVSNLVYAAHGDCVDTVIVGGRVVMQHGRVPEQERIVEEARRMARRLITV